MPYTPGPWKFTRPHNQPEGIWAHIPHLDRAAMTVEVSIRPSLIIGEDGNVYALLAYESHNQFPSEDWLEMQASNAQLIAAAPDLLEALVFLTTAGDLFQRDEALTAARAAIAKATKSESETE